MPAYQELVQQAEVSRRRITGADRPRVAVCVDTSSIASGALKTLVALREVATAKKLNVDVDQVGGNGLSFANPVVIVSKNGGDSAMYQQVSADDAEDFLESVVKDDFEENRWLLGVIDGFGSPKIEVHDWWTIQTRRLMQDMGICDPDNIDDYLARGAYSGLEQALTMSQEEVIAELTGSKLSGRSGGFFPAGRKWDFLRTSPTSPKAMVCNADEGDPGAWVNRMTLENDPHALIEGMLVGGAAAGAERGYIYIREEYPLAFERVQRAVDQAYERGVLGENILGHGFNFDMKVVRGAGSYVCGEESGLIASIEDARGMPKLRPPFPAASGVFGQGSNVNNVQTYHGAAWLMRSGIERYADIGTERNPGTMMFSLSGNVQRVGCFELPFDVTVRQAYEICGGGAPEGHQFHALQPGGPLLGIVPDFILDCTIEPEAFREKKAVGLGGGGFVFLDETACVLDLCTQFEWFVEDESCGRCTTCHGGSQRATEILRRIQRGGGRDSDLGKLRLLADTLRYSNCFHGQFALTTTINAIDFFEEEIREHIYDRRCRAKVCKGLIRYEVDRDAIAANFDAVERANDLCLTNARLRAEGQSPTEPCFECAVCVDLLHDFITAVDAFEPGVGPAPELISVQPAYA